MWLTEASQEVSKTEQQDEHRFLTLPITTKDCGKQRCFALHNAKYFIQGHPWRTEIFKLLKYPDW